MKDLIAHVIAEHKPIDVVENVITAQEWTYARQGETAIGVKAPGQWCEFSLYFAWNQELSAMNFMCAFDMRVPPEKRTSVSELLTEVNERLWFGHFGLWREENLTMFRHVLLFKDSDGPSSSQIAELVNKALAECNRFYPAFQYVIWGGKSATDAIALALVDLALVDTVGEA